MAAAAKGAGAAHVLCANQVSLGYAVYERGDLGVGEKNWGTRPKTCQTQLSFVFLSLNQTTMAAAAATDAKGPIDRATVRIFVNGLLCYHY